ncbi:uncharacterized protein CLUP02_14588 [Colletotrichum lupini]|uniref:Uncharacterized protein n=1 Tax=Colletotrichum lupini TaxID=145971 RepID=A0A9Q8WNF8_9PEZI|nr:uncharacterized protein CLUP02_14588 [Colletotrichum lupini]UQC89060.1 hypothetical protein CLUP02_14588 [Colletotrichum lupini]
MINAEWEKISEQVRASRRTAKLLESRLQEREAILAQYHEEDEAVDMLRAGGPLGFWVKYRSINIRSSR